MDIGRGLGAKGAGVFLLVWALATSAGIDALAAIRPGAAAAIEARPLLTPSVYLPLIVRPPLQLRVAIFTGTGVESNTILAVFRAVAALGHQVFGVAYHDLYMGRVTRANFDVLLLPAGEGGSVLGYACPSLGCLGSPTALAAVRSFVASGGGLVGLEAGGAWAAANGGPPGLAAALYAGDYFPTSPMAGRSSFTITTPAFGSGTQEAYLAAGGGYYSTPAGSLVIAGDSLGRPAIVGASYGDGRVALSAYDLELRGDSELDWTLWDNWEMGGAHINSEGAWRVLGRLLSWAATGTAVEPSISSPVPGGARVAVVATHTSEGGASPALLPAFGRAIEWAGHTPLAIRLDDIRAGRLVTSTFGAVAFAGGLTPAYVLGLAGHEQKVRDFVSAGGGYYGVCAGSYYAAGTLVWQGFASDYPLKLFSGRDVGPLDDIAAWPTYGLTPIAINDPVLGNLGTQQQMYYGGGYKDQLGAAVPVATYAYTGAYQGQPAGIRIAYGQGHVLLIGTHPEARSGSNEDWLYWDNWVEMSSQPLVNPDNPWTFVSAALNNWLLAP